MFQVTQIVRFLLEGGLPSRFRNLAASGFQSLRTSFDVDSDPGLQCTRWACVPIYPPAELEGLAFFAPFLEGHASGAFVCDQDLALPVRIPGRDLNRRFGGLQPAEAQAPPSLR
jgi:hypothetical protein